VQAFIRPAEKQPEAKAVVDDGKITEEPETESGGGQLAQSSGDARWHQMSPPERFEDSDLSLDYRRIGYLIRCLFASKEPV
jgi:hypothetical protein